MTTLATLAAAGMVAGTAALVAWAERRGNARLARQERVERWLLSARSQRRQLDQRRACWVAADARLAAARARQDGSEAEALAAHVDASRAYWDSVILDR